MGHDFSEAIGHGKIGSSSKNTLMLVEIRPFFLVKPRYIIPRSLSFRLYFEWFFCRDYSVLVSVYGP